MSDRKQALFARLPRFRSKQIKKLESGDYVHDRTAGDHDAKGKFLLQSCIFGARVKEEGIIELTSSGGAPESAAVTTWFNKWRKPGSIEAGIPKLP